MRMIDLSRDASGLAFLVFCAVVILATVIIVKVIMWIVYRVGILE